jgi:hypothetical protein
MIRAGDMPHGESLARSCVDNSKIGVPHAAAELLDRPKEVRIGVPFRNVVTHDEKWSSRAFFFLTG